MVELIRLAFLLSVVAACGTTHEVSGTAEVRHVITVEADICDSLPEDEKVECIQAIVAAIEATNGGEESPGGFGL